MKKQWLESEIDEVRRRYEAGSTDAEIGAALNRSSTSISNCRQAHFIQRPRTTLKRAPEWKDEEIEEARDMYARGASRDEIATAIGRSRTAIKRLVTERGLVRDPSRLADLDPSTFDTENEHWTAVAGAPSYAVSDRGRVMSLQAGRIGRLLSQWVDDDGYCHVQLQVGGRGKRHSVHRLVATAFIGQPPSATHQAAHCDGIPSNNLASNLRWATPAENQADRLLHGTADRLPGGQFKPSDMIRRAESAGIPVRRVDG